MFYVFSTAWLILCFNKYLNELTMNSPTACNWAFIIATIDINFIT